MNNNTTQAEALKILRKALKNPKASFRDGQWEAIDAIVNHQKKILVVQRTGWGKSSVYFISTRILRDQEHGLTIIISPLLALMRNQIDSAKNLNIHAVTLNSSNQNDWDLHIAEIKNDQVDCLLISPEKLANEEFVKTVLFPIADKIGLFVIDEAHCISDWGHDFRPDYRRITNILKQMPPNMPVLGTTATANDRVIKDIQDQLGDIKIQRGPLLRESLALQNIILQDQPSRLAWLSSNVPKMTGSGIIYVLTKRDAIQVANWLLSDNINAAAYFSDVTHPNFDSSDAYRRHLESQLLNNEIKVLVTTTALGMGYDKPDLGFVFHYQAPGSIIAYYQQVGRAGRGIDYAYGILLSGKEDDKIHRFFRKAAFPTEIQVSEILTILEESDGMSVYNLQQHLNLSKGVIEKALKFLSVENPAPVIKDGSLWKRTSVPFTMDRERIDHLIHQREIEWKEVQDYIQSNQCLMMFLGKVLDDPSATPCGKCANCLGQPLLSTDTDHASRVKAALHLKQSELPFKPKIQVAANAFPIYKFKGNLPVELRASEGRILSRWADAGWGEIVEKDKNNGAISDELVEAMAEMILSRWSPNPAPQWITCVPSLNSSQLVPKFARRLANLLGLPFIEAITKPQANQPQKFQQNRYHQCKNLDGVFRINPGIPKDPVLLVDDVIDSGWTMTVLSALLRQAGCSTVFPVALATTSSNI